MARLLFLAQNTLSVQRIDTAAARPPRSHPSIGRDECADTIRGFSMSGMACYEGSPEMRTRDLVAVGCRGSRDNVRGLLNNTGHRTSCLLTERS